MPWHDETPWARRKRKAQAQPTAQHRVDDIIRQCQAGDISLPDAIRAAYSVGVAYEQARLIPGANAVKE